MRYFFFASALMAECPTLSATHALRLAVLFVDLIQQLEQFSAATRSESSPSP